MTKILAIIITLAVLASLAAAQGTCDCVEYAPTDECVALTEVAPAVCIENIVPCTGCRCIQDGETPTGVCNLVPAVTLYFDGITEDSCSERPFTLAECPNDPPGGSFVVNCGDSLQYASSYDCIFPTGDIGVPINTLSCTMTIDWSSNYSDVISNSGIQPVTTTVLLGEDHRLTYSSPQGLGPVFSDILVTWSSDGPPEWVVEDTAVLVTNLPPGQSVVAAGDNGPFTSIYSGGNDLRDALNAASGGGAADVAMAVAYAPTFSATNLNVNNAERYFSDYRVISCTYT